MSIAVATALVRAADAQPELAAAAVRQAIERAGLEHPHSVLLFLTSEYARCAHAALAGASRAANCLNVWGCTAPGVLTEEDWAIDQPAACAMVIGEGIALGAPDEDDAPQMSFVVPNAASDAWLREAAVRYGLVSSDAAAHSPGRVWGHGKTMAEGRAAASFSHARCVVGVARGIRPLGEPQVVDAADGYDIQRIGHQLALNSLLRALPPELREEPRLPYNQLFAGVVGEPAADAIARGRYRVLPLIAVNHDDRSVTLGQRVEPGARLFWGMRTPLGAEEEMRRTIDAAAAELGAAPDLGVLFSCMGRGPYFYGGRDRDLDLVRARYPKLPLIGAYGAGQIAPLYEGNALVQNSALLALVRAQ